jgi:hypothetical protein
MRRARPVHLILLVVLALAGCNLSRVKAIEATPSAVLKVSVSVATEYRTGPGDVYDLAGVLIPGQEFEVMGRSSEGDYLLIRDPSHPADLGWLESDGAILSGVPVGLPIPTPPPTPTSVPASESAGGCPTPIGGGPTPVSCGESPPSSGCPTPIGGGPTPVSCDGAPPSSGCPTPIGGGPTPVSCDGAPPSSGCPTPIGGGPTPVSCFMRRSFPTPVEGGRKAPPTPVK